MFHLDKCFSGCSCPILCVSCFYFLPRSRTLRGRTFLKCHAQQCSASRPSSGSFILLAMRHIFVHFFFLAVVFLAVVFLTAVALSAGFFPLFLFTEPFGRPLPGLRFCWQNALVCSCSACSNWNESVPSHRASPNLCTHKEGVRKQRLSRQRWLAERQPWCNGAYHFVFGALWPAATGFARLFLAGSRRCRLACRSSTLALVRQRLTRQCTRHNRQCSNAQTHCLRRLMLPHGWFSTRHTCGPSALLGRRWHAWFCRCFSSRTPKENAGKMGKMR